MCKNKLFSAQSLSNSYYEYECGTVVMSFNDGTKYNSSRKLVKIYLNSHLFHFPNAKGIKK